MKGVQKIKSISVLVPLERVQASLSEIGFLLDDTVTIVADGKFWNKMLYVRGEYDPDSLFRGLAVDGSNPITGYGILVVEDSDLAFFQSGQFRWNGIVLLTGRNNSSAFLGSSNTEIRGALITNETNPLEPAGFSEFAVKTSGTMRILASKENIDRALMALYNMRISAFREH